MNNTAVSSPTPDIDLAHDKLDTQEVAEVVPGEGKGTFALTNLLLI
jgi:hypothetical protein